MHKVAARVKTEVTFLQKAMGVALTPEFNRSGVGSEWVMDVREQQGTNEIQLGSPSSIEAPCSQPQGTWILKVVILILIVREPRSKLRGMRSRLD